jgi:deoxyribodipyrimidine photo-lyase
LKRISVFWFRRDLRLDDNIGLFNALKESESVLPLFIFDENILSKLKEKNDKRVSFIHKVLSEMDESLQKLGSSLLVKFGTPEQVWNELLAEFEVESVYINHDYESYAIARDKKVEKSLLKRGIKLYSFKDQCIFEKDEVLKKDKTPYTVYTPYKNKWYEHLKPVDILSVICK